MNDVLVALVAFVVGAGIGFIVGLFERAEHDAADWGKHLKDWQGEVTFTPADNFYDQDREGRIQGTQVWLRRRR